MALETNDPAKASTMRALMSNPDMFKTIFDAHDSPIGSTQRQKASGILSSVHANAVGQLGGAQQPTDPNALPYGLSSSQTPAKPTATSQMGLPDIDPNAPSNKMFFVKSVDDLMPNSTIGKTLNPSQTTPSGSVPGGLSSSSPISFGKGPQTATDKMGLLGGDALKGTPLSSFGVGTFGDIGDINNLSVAEQFAAIRKRQAADYASPAGPQKPTSASAPAPVDTSVENRGPYSWGEAVQMAKELAKSEPDYNKIFEKVKSTTGWTVPQVSVTDTPTGTGASSDTTSQIGQTATTNWASILPNGSTYTGGRDNSGQCGVLVNDMTGIGVSDSLASKKAVIDPTINTPSNPLQVGDVAVINKGPFGHVAVINAINGDGTVTLTEQNWKTDGQGHGIIDNTRKLSLNDPALLGFGRGTLNANLQVSGTGTGTMTGFPSDSSLDASALLSMTDAQREAWYEKQDPASQDAHKPLFDAIKSGDKQSFITALLSDKNAYAKFMGKDPASIDGFPMSDNLNQTLADLWTAKKQEHNVDGLRSSLIQKEAAGLDVKKDLQAYIRGKDEYLGTVDKMLEDAQTKIDHMDPTNPIINNRMKNYVDYLTVLQGRQNQRYIDYLNTSIQYQSDDVNRTNYMYQDAYQKAKDEYDSAAPATTEDYNKFYNQLSDIYDKMDGRIDSTTDIFKKQMDLAGSQLDLLKKVTEGETAKIKLQSDKIDLQKKMLGTPDKILPGDITKWTESFYVPIRDSAGKIQQKFQYVDPLTVLDRMKGTQADTGGYFEAYTGIIQHEIDSQSFGGDFMGALTKYKPGESNLIDTALALQQNGQTDEANQVAQYATQFRDAERKGLATGVSGYLGGNPNSLTNPTPSKVPSLRKVITNMGKSKYKSVDDVLKSSEGKALGSDISYALYKSYTDALTQQVKPKDYSKTLLALSDSALANQLGGYIAEQYMTLPANYQGDQSQE